MTEPSRTRYTYKELSALDELDIDCLCSLYSVELGGEDFYNAMAEHVDDYKAAELLRRNGREEAGHARRVQRAISLKLGIEFEPTPEMLERKPVRLPADVGLEFLRLLVQGEFDGDVGYQRWADHESNPDVARLLRLNGREESIHGHRVEEAIALLTKG